MAIDKITSAGLTTSTNQPNFRNIIINGDMSLAQRGTSFSSISSGNSNYPVDRFRANLTTTGTWTMSQDTTVPTGQGFATSVKYDCTTADGSLAAGDYLLFQHIVEAQNLQYLKFGTSSAESLTLSFWVKSNKTGTYIAEFYISDTGRSFSKSYTIDSADTWEKKTITFPGDTGGSIDNNNGVGIELNFWLAAGSTYSSGSLQTSWGTRVNANMAAGQVNLADSTSNEFYITGVQLEAGLVASDFEFLPYDVNLQRCQRYYYLHVSGSQDVGVGGYYSSSHIFFNITFPNTMRAVPTIVYVSGTDYYKISRNSATDNFNDIAGGGVASLNEVSLYNNNQVSGTAGDAGYVRSNNASASIALNSEL